MQQRSFDLFCQMDRYIPKVTNWILSANYQSNSAR